MTELRVVKNKIEGRGLGIKVFIRVYGGMEDYVLFMREGAKEYHASIRIHDHALNPLKGCCLNPTQPKNTNCKRQRKMAVTEYLCASSYLIFCCPMAIGDNIEYSRGMYPSFPIIYINIYIYIYSSYASILYSFMTFALC